MRKMLIILALVALPSKAFASGIDISWNDCVGGTTGAAANINFGCASAVNETYSLYVQLKSPVDIPNVVAFDAFLALQDETPGPLAPFWHYEGAGCQSVLPGLRVVDAMPPSCGAAGFLNVGGGITVVGFSYIPDTPLPGHARLPSALARLTPTPITIIAGRNYYVMHLEFNNRNRPGSGGNCAGCTDKVAVLLNGIRISQPAGAGPPVDLFQPDKFSNCVTINGANPGSCNATPARNTTWGRIKGLYR